MNEHSLTLSLQQIYIAKRALNYSIELLRKKNESTEPYEKLLEIIKQHLNSAQLAVVSNKFIADVLLTSEQKDALAMSLETVIQNRLGLFTEETKTLCQDILQKLKGES